MQEDTVQLGQEKNNPSLKLFVILSKTYRSVMEQADKDIQKSGLNLTDFAVMELLYHKGKQPLQKIGKKILLTSGSITYVIDKLEKKGYLTRIPCSKDRRVTYASLTDKGSATITSIFPKHANKISELMDVLSEQEKETVSRLLKKVGKDAAG